MIHVGTVAAIAWGALAFGAVYSWAYVPLLVACACLGLLGLRSGTGVPMRESRAILIAMALIGVAGLVQLIPLPAAVLRTISPSTDAFLQEYDLAYAVNGASHPLSIDPQATMVGLAFLAALAVFMAGLTRAFSRWGVSRLVFSIVVFGGLVGTIAVVQKLVLGDHAFMGMKIYGFWTPESKLVVPFGPYVNRNHYAGWMLMAIPLAAGYLCGLLPGAPGRGPFDLRARVLWLSSPDGGKAVLVALAIVIMTLSMGLSMSRSGIGCLVVGMALVAWRLFRSLATGRARLASIALFLLLVCAPVSWVGLNATVERFSTDSVGSLPMRLHAWRDTLSVVRHFPLAGTGLNTFGTAMIVYQTGSLDVHFQESHNDYLQLAAEGGLLLGIPIVAAGLLFVRTVRRRFAADQSRTASWIRFGAVAGLVAIAVQSLVEFSLQMPGNAAMFVVLLALALHTPRVRRSATPGTA